jgi:hypothetical protein
MRARFTMALHGHLAPMNVIWTLFVIANIATMCVLSCRISPEDVNGNAIRSAYSTTLDETAFRLERYRESEHESISHPADCGAAQ